jgi:biotin carboxyl carrier protein
MEKQDNEKKSIYKTLLIDGTKYKTILTPRFENRIPYEADNPKKMISFIPGTISKLFVKEGQHVKKGARLFILEAMKMKNRIEAPFNGVIKKIYVQEGDIVPKRQLLLEFE